MSRTERYRLFVAETRNDTMRTALRAAEAALAGTGTEIFCAPELGCLSLKVEEACSESS